MVDVSKAPDKISGMFDAIAGNYDFLNHLLSAGIDKRWRKRAVRSLALTGRERVLDLCTGTADLAIAARTASPGAIGPLVNARWRAEASGRTIASTSARSSGTGMTCSANVTCRDSSWACSRTPLMMPSRLRADFSMVCM